MEQEQLEQVLVREKQEGSSGERTIFHCSNELSLEKEI